MIRNKARGTGRGTGTPTNTPPKKAKKSTQKISKSQKTNNPPTPFSDTTSQRMTYNNPHPPDI